MKTKSFLSASSRIPATRLLPALLCAVALAPSSHAASFGNVAEESFYAGVAWPLFYVGAILSTYIMVDVGEAFYFGFQESTLALQNGPDNRPETTIFGDSELGGIKLAEHANLGMKPALGIGTSSQKIDLALDPRFQAGDSTTDVCGFRLGLLSAVDHDVYGIDICTLAGRTLGDEYGLQLGLFNVVDGDVGGIQVGLSNVAGRYDSSDMDGIQIGVINICNRGSGLQLGVWNQARSFVGVQIGLCNAISEGPIPFLPILNASF